jgi:1-phosphatidylinositol-4-phosphate 5-kinase
MMLGVSQSVRNVLQTQAFELNEQDFGTRFCYQLPIQSYEKNKKSGIYEFYDFSPRVFHLIRTMYGIAPNDYMKSIGPEKMYTNLLSGNFLSFQELCSTGKSGSFFYYTSDSKYMLKTVSKEEFHFLRSILKEYFFHLSKFPHTLITRFLGLHKIKYRKSYNDTQQRVYFLVMCNVFNTSAEIHKRYDLKGSLQGRKTRKDPT